MAIRLRPITKENWDTATNLKLPDEQQKFVSPNWYSILQEIFLDVDIYCRAIYEDEIMIGFAMMGQDPDDQSCFISRLMISHEQQGKGYGRAALKAVIEDMKARYNPSEIIIRVAPENKVAFALYRSMGFLDTGEIHRGEAVLRLPLSHE
jgi:diamine N-acetyltransferase